MFVYSVGENIDVNIVFLFKKDRRQSNISEGISV